MPPQPDLKAESKELSATLGLARKKPLNFALLIAKKGLVLETDPRKPVETLRTAAKKKGGGKGAWGTLRCEGTKLTLTCEKEPPGNLQQLAKKHFADRGQSLQVEIALADGAEQPAPAAEEPKKEAAAPQEDEPAELDVGKILQQARKKPFNVAWLIGQGGLVLRAHRRLPVDKLRQEAKSAGGGPRGACGVMTVGGKTITLHCEEAPPDAFPRLAKAWLGEQEFAYKVKVALPDGTELDSDAEAAAAEGGADGAEPGGVDEKLGRAFTALKAEIARKQALMSSAERQTAQKLLEAYSEAITNENPARALKSLKAMHTLLARIAEPPPTDAGADASPQTGGAESEKESNAPPGAPPDDGKIAFIDGAVTGRQIATQGGNPINAGQRADKGFGSKDEAIAYARSLKGAAAVRVEDGAYAVYKAKIDSMAVFGADLDLDDAAKDSTKDADDSKIQRTDKALIAIITEDDYIIRTDSASGAGTIDRDGSALGPFEGPIQAFGPGLENIKDRETFEEQFALTMRDTAFAAIASAEAAAKEMREKLNKPLGAAERATLGDVMEKIAPITEELEDKEHALLLAKAQLYGGYAEQLSLFTNPFAIPGTVLKNLISSGDPIDMKEEERKKVAQLEAEVAEIKARRSAAAKDFPLALRIEDPEEFKKLPQAEQDQMLRDMADGVLEDIETTRENIEGGDFDFWTMPGVREATAAGLGLKGQQLDWARDRAGWEQKKDSAKAGAEAVITIGLAIGAIVASGGWALAFGAGALAAGGYSAYDVTEEYFRKGSAADIALDPSQGLVPPEDAPHWGWVAAAWIGLGFDAAAVRSAVKALKAGKELAEAAKILGVPANKIDDVLRPALMGREVSSFKAVMEGEAAFANRFGDSMSEAATVVTRNAKGGFDVEVVVRAGADPAVRQAAVAEEMRHLQQLSDPAFADDLAKLTEDALAGWTSKNPTQKMEAARAQLRLEADSQTRLLAELQEALAKAPNQQARTAILDQIENATLDLESYAGKLAKVEEALPSGRIPPDLDLAHPPRLFNTPQTRATNKAALKAMPGIGKVPDGYYFAKVGDGFQLRRYRASVEDGLPKMRAVKKGKKWTLEKVKGASTAERRASIESTFSKLTGNKALDGAIDTLAQPYHKAYARRFQKGFELLAAEYKITPDEIIKSLDTASDAKFEKSLRRTIRRLLVEKVSKAKPADRAKALDDALSAMPGNRTKGDLFSEFRAQNLGDKLQHVDAPKGGTTLKGTKKQGDGIAKTVGKLEDLPGNVEGGGGKGPAKLGEYLVEDKSSEAAFDLAQYLRYVGAKTDEGEALIETADGATRAGVLYYFPDKKVAKEVLEFMRDAGLPPNVHVAYFEKGKEVWLR